MSEGDPMVPTELDGKPVLILAPMCPVHHNLLMVETGFLETDPWRALTVATQIALFQALTVDPRTHEAIGGQILRIAELGCMACRKPDAFGEICEAARGKDLGAIKALGERWVASVQASARPEA